MLSPSNGTFATSAIVFVLALTWIIQEGKEDRLQDHVLLGGSFAGAVLGLVAGFDTQGIMLSVMPGAALAAVVLSVILHEVWERLCPSNNDRDGFQRSTPTFIGKKAVDNADEVVIKGSDDDDKQEVDKAGVEKAGVGEPGFDKEGVDKEKVDKEEINKEDELDKVEHDKDEVDDEDDDGNKD
jgi:hypothetical protein